MKNASSILFLFVLAGSLLQTQPVYSRQTAPKISLLDRAGQQVNTIVDGNQVRLRFESETAVDSETRIDFSTPGTGEPIAGCTIAVGADACETPSFPALGWYWDPDGSAIPERTIHASVNGIQASAGLIVRVVPRPVVMVHGFNSDYTAWTNYLGPAGYGHVWLLRQRPLLEA